MKRFIPYLILLVAGLWLGASWIAPKPTADDFDVRTFSRLPVLVGGRIKPLDTVARNSLLIMRGKQTLRLANGGKDDGLALAGRRVCSMPRWRTPIRCLPCQPGSAGNVRLAAGGQALLHLRRTPALSPENRRGGTTSPRTPKPRNAPRSKPPSTTCAIRSFSISNSRAASNRKTPPDFGAEINTYAEAVAAGAAAMKQGAAALDKDQLVLLKTAVARYESQAQAAYMLAVAPPAGGQAADWLATGAALIRVSSPETIPASVSAFADMGDAFRAGDRAAFARVANEYAGWLAIEHPDLTGRAAYELRFNLIAAVLSQHGAVCRRVPVGLCFLAGLPQRLAQDRFPAARARAGRAFLRHVLAHVAARPSAGHQSLLLRHLRRLGRGLDRPGAGAPVP